MNRYKRILVSFGAGLALLAASITPAAAAKASGGYPVVFMSVRSGHGQLHLLKGNVDVALAGNSNGHDCGPAFKPGGKYLLFDSNRLTHESSPTKYVPPGVDDKGNLALNDADTFQIYLLNLKTGKVRQLTTDGGLYPTSSPDGRQFAYTSGDSIWVMNSDGSSKKRITLGSPSLSDEFPAWSPDGKKIAFTVSDEPAGTNPHLHASSIYTVDPNGGNLTRLTADGEFPAWSHDGKYIAFDSARGQANPFETDLYVMRADGSRQTKIQQQDGTEMMPDWSPDGKHMVYVHDDHYFTGLVALGILPTGNGVEAWGTGQATQVWQLTLDKSLHAVAHERLSNGTTDLFPRYAPVHNVG